VVAAVLASAALLGACGAGSQPSAADLTACGSVNSVSAGAFAVELAARQETLAAQLLSQAKAAGNEALIKGAEQLQVAAAAESGPRTKAALTTLSAVCTSMGIGPSSGGV
jgi:hypothetical protein